MMAASIVPCSIAATAVAPRPDADHADRIRIDAVLVQQYLRKKSVEEPGALTPTFLLARSLIDLISAGVLGRHHQRETGEAVIDHEGLQMLALGGEIDAMVEIAGDDVGRAADHRLERFRAALEVDDVDIHAGLFVFAELLGQHGRQIAEAGAAADRERHLRLRQRNARSKARARPAQPPAGG